MNEYWADSVELRSQRLKSGWKKMMRHACDLIGAFSNKELCLIVLQGCKHSKRQALKCIGVSGLLFCRFRCDSCLLADASRIK